MNFLTKHRFHAFGIGWSYANLIGFAVALWVLLDLFD